MIPTRSAPQVALLTLALGLLAGCGNPGKTVSPGGGDTGGNHLVVFASDRNQTAGQLDLYLYDLDAQGFRAILNINSALVPDLNPSISSDGLVIAFESNRGGTGQSDILLYSRALQRLIDLPGVNTAADEIEPSITGDAAKLAFARSTAGVKRVHMVDGVGDTLLPLAGLDTTATFSDWSPSPDQTGARIAFVSDRNGTPDIFVWDRVARTVLNLPDLISPGNDVDPSLTPDGRLVCFASDRSGGMGGYDLYLYNINTKALITLPAVFNSTADERHPSVSRSGDIVVFQSNRSGGSGLRDLYNGRISTNSVGRGTQQSSSADDVDPSLMYP